jgi:predicted nucleic acid-binding protein
MAIKYLIDTNVFLEILLNQEKKELCKKCLTDRFGEIAISDFSLHSVGMILFRNKKFELLNSFVNDVLSQIEILTLRNKQYLEISQIAKKFNLDFDDAYQVTIASVRNLIIITMDKDFEKVGDFYKIEFI